MSSECSPFFYSFPFLRAGRVVFLGGSKSFFGGGFFFFLTPCYFSLLSTLSFLSFLFVLVSLRRGGLCSGLMFIAFSGSLCVG